MTFYIQLKVALCGQEGSQWLRIDSAEGIVMLGF